MTYNLTNVTQSTGLLGQMSAINQMSNGVLFIVMIFMYYFIIMVTFRHHGALPVMVGGSFILIIITTFFYFLRFISWHIMVIPIVLFFVSLVMYKLT